MAVFLKAKGKVIYPNVSLANMKAQTHARPPAHAAHSINHSFTFTVLMMTVTILHQLLKVQICLLLLRAPLTEKLSLKSQRHSVARVNVSVTAYFIWGVLSAGIVK